jgi:hypothetical protein
MLTEDSRMPQVTVVTKVSAVTGSSALSLLLSSFASAVPCCAGAPQNDKKISAHSHGNIVIVPLLLFRYTYRITANGGDDELSSSTTCLRRDNTLERQTKFVR